MIGFDIGPPVFDPSRAITASGRVAQVQAVADAAYFHARVKLTSPILAGETMTIGYDTYADDRGESILPNGVQTRVRSEFALQLTGSASARLFVTDAYDQFGVWHARNEPGPANDDSARTYHSTRTDGGPWNLVRWKNDAAHGSDDGTFMFPATVQEIGVLRIRLASDKPSTSDAVVVDGNQIDIRLPWTLLQVADPTQRSVIDDDKATWPRETTTTDGIALAVSFAGELVETPRVSWNTWNEPPPFREYEKASLEIVAQQMRALSE
jgi:hypothetical protein